MTQQSSNQEARSLLDQIELCADGELTASQRSALLLRLDVEPQHWRTLALAFVEQQVVRHVVREAFVDPATQSVKVGASSTPQTKHRTWAEKSHALSALVATVMLAIGLMIGNQLQLERGPDELAQAQSKQASYPPGISESVVGEGVGSDNEKEIGASGPVATAVNQRKTPGRPQQIDESGVVGYLRWQGRYGPQLSPVLASNRVDSKWLAENPPQVNRQLQRRLAQAGVELQPQRRLVSLQINGGRYTIPMDDVAVRPVDREVF